jgi:hypothetical protein
MTMLTAFEARKITEESDIKVDNILDQLDSLIRARARACKDTLSCYLPDTWYASTLREGIHPNDFQRKIMNKLADHGFKVKLARDGDPYVPKGLADNEGNGPIHYNWCIVIGW